MKASFTKQCKQFQLGTYVVNKQLDKIEVAILLDKKASQIYISQSMQPTKFELRT